ncbi:MAG: hypothetical protein WC547_04300 [Candidatus Omnitrophota bacterium]
MVKGAVPLHVYKSAAELMNKAYRASRAVVDENKRLGIATPFSLRGKIYFLMPDGKIVMKRNGRKK